MFQKVPILLGLCALLCGCAFTPHDVDLKPVVSVPPSTVGTKTKVAFHFQDERADTTVGHRSISEFGAKISADDLSDVIVDKLHKAYVRKGYAFVPTDAEADAVVTYRLRAFQFYIETGFWTGGQNASAVLAVDALRGGRTYSNVYRVNSEDRILFIPGGGSIDEQMNGALSQMLQKAVSDGNLDLFLSGKDGTAQAATGGSP